ncbi:MAG: alanine--tRNA ligase [Abditibacteriota bacterium]|nr:alanine--tRNA ligase [Abditibacteriota bacterium]
MLTSNDVRSAYLRFFESKGSLVLPSDSLVPNDPSLLFTSAGMVQFKPYFMGEKKPPCGRVATSQKCMRTDDIEEVGDAVHHTFFEMLGNFSFGDYFKREAISWAWEFLTEVLHVDPEHLWTTVYKDDNEAFDMWNKGLGFPADKIIRAGAHTNYWPADAPAKGPNGVCGPCNEIYLDVAPEQGRPEDPAWSIANDSNRFVEIWNLVFTQFDRQDDGTLLPLPFRNIDTGMGLERATAVLNGLTSNYDTDLFLPIIRQIEHLSGKKYKNGDMQEDRCFRVISDHIRSAVFAMSDGVMPSNGGRGYVLRRLIRNAVLKGRRLGLNENFMTGIIPCVVDKMGSVYPELIERSTFAESVMSAEEEKFRSTLESGMQKLEDARAEVREKGGNMISGQTAFSLYDTFGFPLEITVDVCREEGLLVDVEGFDEAMNEQRTRGKESGNFSDVMGAQTEKYIRELEAGGAGKTVFTGYGNLHDESFVTGIIKDGRCVGEASEGEEVLVVCAKTPFYGEMGGQVGDRGSIKSENASLTVTDTKRDSGYFIHYCRVDKGTLVLGSRVSLSVSSRFRMDIERNHSATHILHSAIQTVFGEHAVQSGSYVSDSRLRFDYSHFAAPTPEEIVKIENIVNEAILSDMKVSTVETSISKARELGAKALFGEKYGETVRVVDIFGMSREFCGGTHVQHSSQIGLFKIVSEGSVGAGIRRIEAVTGRYVLEYLNDLDSKLTEIAGITNSQRQDVVNSVRRLAEANSELEEKLEAGKERAVLGRIKDLIVRTEVIGDTRYLGAFIETSDPGTVKMMVDAVIEEMKSGCVLIGGITEGKIVFVCKATEDLIRRGVHCGKIIRTCAAACGGKGGGKPDFAQGGGRDPEKLQEAFAAAKNEFTEQLR